MHLSHLISWFMYVKHFPNYESVTKYHQNTSLRLTVKILKSVDKEFHHIGTGLSHSVVTVHTINFYLITEKEIIGFQFSRF